MKGVRSSGFLVSLVLLAFGLTHPRIASPLKQFCLEAIYRSAAWAQPVLQPIRQVWPHPTARPGEGEQEVLLTKVSELEQENVRLKGLLTVRPASGPTMVVALVLARDLTHWRSSLVVSRGSADGIVAHQPVTSPAGLVGQIIDVAPHVSRVLEINDPDSRVSCLLQRTRQPGILAGSVFGGLWLQWLPPDADVQIGDRVITSGLGPVYPKGLSVGTVEAVEPDPSGVFKQALVKPATALDRLEEVIILR